MKKQFILSLFMTLIVTNNLNGMASNLSPEEIERQRIAINTALRLNPKQKFTGPDWEHFDQELINEIRENKKSKNSTVIRGAGPSHSQSIKKNEEIDQHPSTADVRDYVRKKKLKNLKKKNTVDPIIKPSEVRSPDEIKETINTSENPDQTTNRTVQRQQTPSEHRVTQEISSPSNLQVFLLATGILTPIVAIMVYIWHKKMQKPPEAPKTEPKPWHIRLLKNTFSRTT